MLTEDQITKMQNEIRKMRELMDMMSLIIYARMYTGGDEYNIHAKEAIINIINGMKDDLNKMLEVII